jgi:predicted PurR-regulated permease PerM
VIRRDASRVALATLAMAGVAGGFGLVYALREALFLVFGAIVIGAAARPAVQRLERAGLSRTVAAVVLYLALVAACLAAAVLLVPLVSAQLAVVGARLPADVGALGLWLSRSHNPILVRLASRVTSLLVSSPVNAETQELVSSAVAFLGALGRAWMVCLLVTLVSFFWMLDGPVAVRSLLRFVALERRPAIHQLVDEVESRVGAFVRGQLFVCLISATVLSIAYLILGLRYALVLGLIGGALEVVPLFGPIAGALPALLVAASARPMSAAWVGAVALGNHLVESYVVAPRIMSRAVGVKPFIALVSLSAFGSLYGIAGAVLAIPIAAILQLLLDRLVLAPARSREPERRDHGALLSLRARDVVLDVRKLVRNKRDTGGAARDEAEDLIEAIAAEVERLIADDESART